MRVLLSYLNLWQDRLAAEFHGIYIDLFSFYSFQPTIFLPIKNNNISLSVAMESMNEQND